MSGEENKNNTGTNVETKDVKTPKVRKHKTLGDYRKVIVNWKQANKNNVEVFVGINNYTAQFKPDIEVELPEKVIKFLREATYEEHYFDEGDKKHKTRAKRKYTIELIEEE